MRGTSDQQIESLVVLTPEDIVPQEHPIRRIKPLADQVIQELSLSFSRMYAKGGRPSVPPEHLCIRSFVKEIVVRPGNATIHYTIPISQSKQKTELLLGGRPEEF